MLWQEEGLNAPSEVTKATQGYQEEQDIIGAFLEEWCETEKGYEVWNRELYPIYKEWASENRERILSQTDLGHRFREKGFESKKSGSNRGWKGFKLNPEKMAVWVAKKEAERQAKLAAQVALANAQGAGTEGTRDREGSKKELDI